jgi:signal transduction histidine kinase
MDYEERPSTGPEQSLAALRERVKELTCLYGLAQMAARPGADLEEILPGVLEFLPPAWQFPEVTAARIILDGRSYVTANFTKRAHIQSADLVVEGRARGRIDIVYTEPRPPADEGPFLKEERSLLDAVANQLGLIIQRVEAEHAKARVEDQLRHADRLATIGQLAAGVAHELNEPLGSILGFAQLAQKQPRLPPQAADDLGKIVTTALHAREVIRKLMLFARQSPPRKTHVRLNLIVDEALSLVASRCAQGSVTVVRRASPRLPEIVADPSQVRQVLVNLLVNAIQAMPGGGTLTVTTSESDNHVLLEVADTGTGMSEDVLRQLFVPFFTTKDVNEGTGLGLPVVHGIVTAHGGTIQVESRPGCGARFRIRLPADDRTARQESAAHEPLE